MMLAVESHYALPSSIPPAAVWAGAVLACAIWAAGHAVPRPAARWLRALLAAGRVGVGFGAALAVAQAMQTALLLATSWPVWAIALLAAGAVEAVVALYRLERKGLPSRQGLAILSLRVLLVALVAALLAQPVRSLQWTERLPRFVAVVVDDSASMHIRDNYGPWEKVRLAEALAMGVLRPYRLEAVEAELERLRQGLTAEVERLDLLSRAGPDARRKDLQEKRGPLHEAISVALQGIEGQLERLSPQRAQGIKLEAPVLSAMEDVRTLLAVRVRDPLQDAAATVRPGGPEDFSPFLGRVLESLRRVQAALAEAAPKVQVLGRDLDDAAYAALGPEKRKEVDLAASLRRSDIARALLQAPGREPKNAPSLLERLEKDYSLRAYEVAATTVESRPEEWPRIAPATPATRPAPTGPAATAPAARDPAPASAPGAGDENQGEQTDLAGALRKVLADLPADRVAGVLLLSDGRHNALGLDVHAAAQQLGAAGVKVYPVPIGAQAPPTDATIVSVDVPEVVFAQDKMYVSAELAFGGLAGKRLRVGLYDDANREVDATTVLVPSDSFRARVQLADTPQKPGTHSYRLLLQQSQGEAFASNNEQSLSVAVTDDRVRLLLIDGLPRWEFRYLKNLFAGRDKTVRLQYVLFSPDRVPGLPVPPPVVASAAAPEDKVEATALPQTLEEWMKFDAIILGDVSPQSLSARDQEAIRRFVTDRGGALVVVGGRFFMPQAYFDTPLADVLPVMRGAEAPGAEATGPFRIALTPEGRGHLIPRLAVDPPENDRLWESMPLILWRLRGLRAKPGAAALAYALPSPPPAAPAAAGASPSPQQARNFQRDRALLLEQSAGLGEVLMLTFDQTWRLRYQAGDTYHHKFWGQVLRWATANKLPSGTSLVKIGADRARYWPGEHVRIRSRLVQPDLTPVKGAEAALRISRDGQFVSRKPMEYRPDSPGLYEADLGPLPPGRYRAELDSPAARELLAAENEKTVQAQFTVAASTPQEEIELSTDRGLLNSLAQRTGGEVLEPAGLQEAPRRLGPGQVQRPQRSEYAIWSHWPLLALILVVATAEWLLRKKAGLA